MVRENEKLVNGRSGKSQRILKMKFFGHLVERERTILYVRIEVREKY